MTIALAIFVFPLMIVTAFFCLELCFGLQSTGAAETVSYPNETHAVVVVPANNEAEIIGHTLPPLIKAAIGVAELLIVADNCTDRTAEIVESLGVKVASRSDPQHRGKGFALGFARDVLAQKPPQVVIVLDADCSLDREGLMALVGLVQSTGQPHQAINLLRPRLSASPMVQISTFAFMLKNLVRQRGLARLSGGVHLTGTGMALPWEAFARANLATSSIVEDIRLGIELAQGGTSPLLAEDATVWSSPSEDAGTLIQRRRWEGGFLSLATRTAPRLLLNSILTVSPRKLATALDLCVPPAAILFVINAAAWIALIILAAFGLGSWSLALAQSFVAAMACGSVLAAWGKEGRAYVSGTVLFRIPAYVAWKIPMYIGLLLRRNGAVWTRTGR